MADEINLDLDPARSRAHILRLATSLSAFDPQPVENRLGQVAIGLLRAMAAQGAVVVRAPEIDAASATAPNRRLFFEAAMTLAWLREDGDAAVDALIRQAKHKGETLVRDLPELSRLREADIRDLQAVVVGTDKSRDRFAHVKHMAEIIMGGEGLYFIWAEETRYAHASMDLAISYSPQIEGVLRVGTPPVLELENGMDLALLLAFSHVHEVLKSQDEEALGKAYLDVYFDAMHEGESEQSLRD